MLDKKEIDSMSVSMLAEYCRLTAAYIKGDLDNAVDRISRERTSENIGSTKFFLDIAHNDAEELYALLTELANRCWPQTKEGE